MNESGEENMNFHLSNILSSSEDYKIVNRTKGELVQFAVYPDYDQYSESKMVKHLSSFIKELAFFPMYIHVVASYPTNFSNEWSNTKEMSTNHFEYYYTEGQINRFTQFRAFFPAAFSDASNGEMVILTSEKELTLVLDEPTGSDVQFEFNFDHSFEKKFYVVIHADGDCWDFISNSKEHPYSEYPIVDEE